MLGELHSEGQTILLTTHYMEEADRLCERVAIMDHGRILALDTPAALKQSVGADTVVTVSTVGDPAKLAELLAAEVAGVARTRLVAGGVQLHVKGNDRLVPRIVLPLSVAASTWSTCRFPSLAWRPCSSTSPARSCGTDGHVHGLAAEPADAPRAVRRIGGGPTRSVAAASWTALGALMLRDLVVLRKHVWEFVLRTLIQPFLLVLRLPVRVSQDRAEHRRARQVAQSAFATSWCREWSGSRSCSRASSRSP